MHTALQAALAIRASMSRVVIGELRLTEINGVGHSELAFTRLADLEIVDMKVAFERSQLY